jgi:hypothetical protein
MKSTSEPLPEFPTWHIGPASGMLYRNTHPTSIQFEGRKIREMVEVTTQANHVPAMLRALCIAQLDLPPLSYARVTVDRAINSTKAVA